MAAARAFRSVCHYPPILVQAQCTPERWMFPDAVEADSPYRPLVEWASAHRADFLRLLAGAAWTEERGGWSELEL
jgi:hypothetical protein